MTNEEKDKITKALIAKRAVQACPRCGQNNFTVIDGYFNQPLQENIRGLVIGGPSIPSAVVACTNCGYLSQHALGALGLLPENRG